MFSMPLRSARNSICATMALLIGVLAGLWAPHAALAGDRPSINTFTPAQRAVLFTNMSNYITKTIIEGHLCPPNDKHGFPRFTVWHRAYIKGMEDYLISQNLPQFVPLPKWLPSTPIPAEFLVGGGVDANCVMVAACGGNPAHCTALFNSNPGIAVPASLSTNLCSQTPFTSFRATLENSYHNGVHGAIGGVMGWYESPAAPIFWLWHAQVDDIWFDWQCVCGLDEAGAFNTYTAAERITDIKAGIADAWMQDSPDDVASQPNTETIHIWDSSDIWVRNSPATPVGTTRYLNEHQHQNAEYAAIPANRPYIYVKVRNRGCTTISGQIHVYWTNASVGLTWPTNFTEVSTSPVTLTNISAGREHVAQFHWLDIPVPGGSAGNHFCLVARFVATPAAADPIIGELNGVIINDNARNSNQIAQKNLTIVDDIANNFAVIVRNVSRDGNLVDLRFTVPAEEMGNPFFQHAAPEIDLGPELFTRWLQNGGGGNEIKIDPRGIIHILGPDSTIDRLPINFNEQYLVNMHFEPRAAPCADDPSTYHLTMSAYEGQTQLGGNTYELRPAALPPNPPVVVMALTSPIRCTQGNVRLGVTIQPPPGSTFQWFRDDFPISNATGNEYLATQSGHYSVLVTYSSGCDTLSDPMRVYIGTPPPNDNPCNAILVALDQPVDFINFCATTQAGEVTPGPGSGPLGGCYAQNGWCQTDTAVQNSMWYRFMASSTGTVTIHAGMHDHSGEHGEAVNMQLAVWRATNCANYGTYQLIAANDDSGDNGIFGADPMLHELTGLIPGTVYLVQLDGYQGDRGEGMLMIEEAAAPMCPCDWNGDGVINSQDFFNFLISFFANQADFNGDGATNSQDFFDFLVCFFTPVGCP